MVILRINKCHLDDGNKLSKHGAHEKNYCHFLIKIIWQAELAVKFSTDETKVENLTSSSWIITIL